MLTSDGSIGIAEIFGRRASDYFQKSRAIRTYDQMAEEVARKIIPLLEHEYHDIPDNERAAAILAVAATFNTASLTGEDIYQGDLSAGYIQRKFGPQSASTLEQYLLSSGATQLYQVLLRESCEYLVQVVKSLPDFQANALTQLLARSTQTISYLQDLLDRLPAREQGDEAQDASVTYRRQVINILDEMELFGASLTESSRHYPLGLAYISLSVVSGKHDQTDDEDGGGRAGNDHHQEVLDSIISAVKRRQTQRVPVESVLQSAPRVFIRGEAGSGKTTVLKIALAMLLERRDLESNIMLDAELSRAQKIIILQDIAYWLVRNGWADADRDDTIGHIAEKLLNMPKVHIDATQTYRRLLERSGLIREPSYHRVDFIHKSFQEYLAAKEALGVGDTGLLINNGHEDQWRDVVVMAAGLADAKKGREILAGLLARGDSEPSNRKKLDLVAMACLETCHEILPTIRTDIQTRVRPLLPPRKLDLIKDLVSCGDIALELLSEMEITDEDQSSASIRLAGEIGSELALDFIRNYRMSTRPVVLDEIRRAWPRFDTIHYAESIVKGSSLDAEYLWVSDSDIITSLGMLDRVQHVECGFDVGKQEIRQLCALPRLRKLTVSISQPDLLRLPRIAALEELNIKVCEFDSEKLLRLADVPHIRSLTIGDYNWIADYHPLEWFRDLMQLRVYSIETDIGEMLSNNGIIDQLSLLVVAHDSGLAYIEQFERLGNPEEIGIVSCKNFRELSGISAWSSSLRHLGISGTDVRSLKPLARLSCLEILDVSNTPVRDLSPIGGLHSLRAVNLAGCDSGLRVEHVLNLPSMEFVVMPDGALWQSTGDEDRMSVEVEKGDSALQWRICQKLVGAQFVPTSSGSGFSEADGERWSEPV